MMVDRFSKDNRFIDALFCLAICLWVLPSGKVLDIPIKLILFSITTFSMIVYLVIRNELCVSRQLIVFLCTLIPLLSWFLLGVSNGFEATGLKILVSFISFFLIVVITIVYIYNFSSIGSLRFVEKALYISVFFFVFFKLILEMLFLAGIISYYDCVHLLKEILNGSTMTLQMDIAGFRVSRFSTPNDTIPLVLLSYDMVKKDRTLIVRFIQFILFGLYSFIVFSRIIFVQFVLVYFICGLLVKENSRRKVTAWVFAFLALTLAILFYSSNDPNGNGYLMSLLVTRFSGKQVSYSDSIRALQARFLWKGIKDNFLFGQGLGAYSKEYVRSSISPASYELEYLSFLFQFGIIGFSLIIVPILYSSFKETVGNTTDRSMRLLVLFNFLIWAGKPLFNPQFLSSSSGAVVSALCLLASYSKSQRNGELDKKAIRNVPRSANRYPIDTPDVVTSMHNPF